MAVGFRVCATKCDQCLFSQHRIVSAKRAAEVLQTARSNDQHFICHKHTLRQMDGQATEDEANVCCKGFYDADPTATNLMRIAGRLGMVLFVDEHGNIVPDDNQGERE